MRLQKYIAASGLCSRREAEERIRQGRVTLNVVTAELGAVSEREDDVVCVDGVVVRPAAEHTYVLLNKPRGYVTTLHDEKDRPTVAELVSDVGVRLYPVGRLDFASEGLLLLTDDGEAANALSHPSHGVRKTYRVTVEGEEAVHRARRLTSSITYEGVTYRPAQVAVVKDGGGTAVLDVTIGEGKNREVRNMCAAVGLRVQRLVRIRQGEILLGRLESGKWRYLTPGEIEYLDRLKSRD